MADIRRLFPTLFGRLSSAVGRRVRSGWRAFREGTRPPLAESTLGWLLRSAQDDGFSVHGDREPPCPGLTAALLPTLWSFGERELAIRCGQRLLALQLPTAHCPTPNCDELRDLTRHALHGLSLF